MKQPLKQDVILSEDDWHELERLILKAHEVGERAKPFDRTTIPEGQSHTVLIFGNYFYHKED